MAAAAEEQALRGASPAHAPGGGRETAPGAAGLGAQAGGGGGGQLRCPPLVPASLQHTDLAGMGCPRPHACSHRSHWGRWLPLTCLTGGSPKAGRALAAEAVDTVGAGPAVLARLGSTLVHI